jgi:hypothetical protein
MVKLTLELDFGTEEELFNSYLWDKYLSKAIDMGKCLSFKTTTEAEEDKIFGRMWWGDEDIVSELDACDFPTTPEAIELVRASLDEDHFVECLIDTGFAHIRSAIYDRSDDLMELVD